MTQSIVTATARDAGRNVVHTVSAEGHRVVAPTRRSAHRYAYAICRWCGGDYNSFVRVNRWSRSAKCSGEEFAVEVTT
jgi:hypothetical protein